MNEYKISEVSKITKLSNHTIRYYDDIGLIKDIKRTNGIRIFNDYHIKCLKRISDLKDCGFDLDSLIKLYNIDDFNNDESIEIILLQYKSMIKKRKELEIKLENIEKLIESNNIK